MSFPTCQGLLCAALYAAFFMGSAIGLETGVLGGSVLPGAGCTNLTELEALAGASFFGNASAVVEPLLVNATKKFTVTKVGLAEDASPVCSLPEAGLKTPCVDEFNVAKLDARVFSWPSISIYQSVSPECKISKCQGQAGQIVNGTIVGNSFSRGTDTVTFGVAMVPDTNGTNTVRLKIIATDPVPIECDIIYTLNGGTVEELLATTDGKPASSALALLAVKNVVVAGLGIVAAVLVV